MSDGVDSIVRYSGNLAGYYYVYFENKSENTILVENFEISGHGYEFDDPMIRDQKEVIKMIDPKHDEIVLVKTSPNASSSKATFYNKTRFIQLLTDDTIITMAMADDQNKKSYPSHGLILHKFSYHGGEGYYYQNVGYRVLKLQVNFSQLVNYEVNGVNNLSLKAYIPPGDGYLMNMRVIDVFASSKHNLTYSYSFDS